MLSEQFAKVIRAPQYQIPIDMQPEYLNSQNPYPAPGYFGRPMNLMNLNSNVNEYHAKAGSATVFDFAKGDPLATTSVNDLHKDAGAKLHFSGSTGKQELGVTGKFLDGSAKRIDAVDA